MPCFCLGGTSLTRCGSLVFPHLGAGGRKLGEEIWGRVVGVVLDVEQRQFLPFGDVCYLQLGSFKEVVVYTMVLGGYMARFGVENEAH